MNSPTIPSRAGNQLLFRFLAVAIIIYLIWFFGYEQWLAQDRRLDNYLCTQITAAAVWCLQLANFQAAISPYAANLITMNGQPAVVVGPPCNGLVLYALFAGFVVAFPGPWQRKLWYIPVGIVVIWGLNVLRVAALAVNQYYAHASVDFNHHYTFTFVVYAFIFGLWMLWAQRLSRTDNQTDTASA